MANFWVKGDAIEKGRSFHRSKSLGSKKTEDTPYRLRVTKIYLQTKTPKRIWARSDSEP